MSVAKNVRVIEARGDSVCNICRAQSHGGRVFTGQKIANRPPFGWVHYPECYSVAIVEPYAKNRSSDGDDLIEPDDDETPSAGLSADVRAHVNRAADVINEQMGVPRQTSDAKIDGETEARIEKRMTAKLEQAIAHQARLLKANTEISIGDAVQASLPPLLASITDSVKRATAELVALKVDEARRDFKAETARAIAKIANSGFVRQEITIHRAGAEPTVLTGEVFHPKFERLLRLAGAGKPIFLPGPTGCGKTHTALQIAKALHGDHWREKFGILSCSPATSERHFLGRSIPKITTGEEVYRAADFVRIYETGGVFCADEIDASDPSVLLVFNAALANGLLPVPDRTDRPIAVRHPDFVFVACANTWGRGADRRYVGRNPLDEATLDRFRIGTVPLDYSEAVERALCPDTDLYDTLKGWRAKIFSERLERVLSSRFVKDAYEMIQSGDTLRDITECFFSGWRPEEQRSVLGKELES